MSIQNNSYPHRRSTIARFDPIENTWTTLGDLKVGRSGNGVIQLNNEFIVVGGSADGSKDEPTESCKLDGQSMICTAREPKLSNGFSNYPELMLIT